MTTDFSEICRILADNGIENPRLETRLLMAAVLHRAPAQIYSDTALNEVQTAEISKLLAERTAHKPLDKILGHREFYKSDFIVDENVLSPRPDTEILVEEALQLSLPKTASVLDLGTGSGCIISSLLLERPQACGTALDISPKSLEIARRNAHNLGLENRINFVCANWFAPDFLAQFNTKFDLIVSNPPYIPTADIQQLATEVKDYDPYAALDGGTDGLDSYRRIAEIAPRLLQPHGFMAVEIGIKQAADVIDIFKQNAFTHIKTAKDLGGIERCLIFQL